MLGFLIAWFSILFSVIGIGLLGLGILLFFGLPVISMATRFKFFSSLHLWLASLPLRRGALVVSEHNDLLFKQMRFDSLGVEVITLDDEEKVFEDPDQSLHHWLGIPFALADEEHGVLFDPRHAAAGMRKRALQARGEDVFDATEDEYQQYNGVTKWLPAVFEMPRRHELVDLSAVQELIQGGERSEYAKRVEELYQHSRAPLQSGTTGVKYLMPVIGFALTFGGIWFMSNQFGGPDETVSYFLFPTLSALAGALPLLGEPDDGDDDDDGRDLGQELLDWLAGVDWALVAGVLILGGLPLLVSALLIVFLGPTLGLALILTVLLGFALLPILTVILGALGVGGALSMLYFKLGLLGYRQPVLEWTPTKYRLREWDQLDRDEDQVQWYDAFGTILGVTYQPGPGSWDAEVLTNKTVEAHQEVKTDGGDDVQSNLPAGSVQSTIKRDTYGGFVPERVRDNQYYIDSAIATGRFNNSATGEKSLRKLQEAKEVYGTGNEGIDDMLVFKATLASGIIGGLLGIGIFILPAFL